MVFWVLIEICWQSASSFFLEGLKCAHITPQFEGYLFLVLITMFMKSCHHHLFNLCTIQRHCSCQGSGSCFSHSLTVPCRDSCLPFPFVCKDWLAKILCLISRILFFFFSLFLCKCHVNLLRYAVSFIASLYLKIIMIFLNVLLAGSLLSQDSHISGRHQILVWCSGVFLINPSILFPFPSMTSSVDIIANCPRLREKLDMMI